MRLVVWEIWTLLKTASKSTGPLYIRTTAIWVLDKVLNICCPEIFEVAVGVWWVKQGQNLTSPAHFKTHLEMISVKNWTKKYLSRKKIRHLVIFGPTAVIKPVPYDMGQFLTLIISRWVFISYGQKNVCQKSRCRPKNEMLSMFTKNWAVVQFSLYRGDKYSQRLSGLYLPCKILPSILA